MPRPPPALSRLTSLRSRGGRTVRLQSLPTRMGDEGSLGSGRGPEPEPGLAGMPAELLEELGPCLEHLFDPENMDHLSLEQQLARIEKRDLWDAKFYKLAVGVFGQQRTAMEMLGANRGRKRIIHARPRHHYRGGDDDDIPPEEPCNAALRPQPPKVNPLSAEALEEIRKRDAVAEYKAWFSERRAFREALDTFGDVGRWLDGKADKTALERCQYKEICAERRRLEEEKVVETEAPVETKAQVKPDVKRPSPLALGIIDAALKKRKMRLVDLFTLVDKDKSWTLSREEFQKAFDAAGIRMPGPLLEDLVITLDRDNNNELDYRELAIGLEQFRIERRRGTDLFSTTTVSEEVRRLTSESEQTEPPSTMLSSRQTTEAGAARERSEGPRDDRSPALAPPPLDTREERYVCENSEAALDLRKRDKIALRQLTKTRKQRKSAESERTRSVIRTGTDVYDRHCAPSSLGGEIGEAVDRCRQAQFREYMALLRVCHERGVVLSEKLLEHVLLYPADKPPTQIRRHVRQPGSRCPVSRAQVLVDHREAARGARRAAREAQEAAERRMRRRRAVNLSQVGAALPTAEELVGDEEDQRVHLSTGWATVRRKVDCWLTFEEYEQLVCNLPLTQHTDIRLPPENAFWPGRMIGKLRLFLEDAQFGPGAVFQPTVPPVPARRSNWGYDNDLRTAPLRGGFLQGQPGRVYMAAGGIGRPY